MDVVYFSGKTNNTKHFVDMLDLPEERIRRLQKDAPIHISDRAILIVPTYADCKGQGAIPTPVVEFLRDVENIRKLAGIVSSGNKFFGSTFALAGRLISQRWNIPLIHTFELRGFPSDAKAVLSKMEALH